MRIFWVWLLLGMSLLAQPYTIMTENLAPYNYLENGKLKGIGTDVVRGLVKRLNIDAEIEVLPWARAYKKLQLYDNHILFSMSRSEAREKLFKWVGPIIVNGVYLYRLASSNIRIKTVDDARNVSSIAVTNNTNTHQQLLRLGFDNLDVSPTTESVYKKLLIGRVDLTPASRISIEKKIREYGGDVSLVKNTGVKILDQHLYIAFSKNVPDKEIRRWQRELDLMKRDGTVKTIYNRYVSGK